MRTAEKICWLLAGLCFLLGCACRFVFTAVRFTGFLLWCAAGVLILWALLSRWSGRKRWVRRARRGLACLLAAGTVLFAVLEVQVIAWSRTDWETEPQAVIVLGAGVNGTVPSLSLQVRLEAALAYLEKWPGVPVVVTGSQGPGEAVSEAACMADWLAARGFPEERIVLEDQADNTEENIRFSLALLEERGVDTAGPIAVVSSGYHLYRASLHMAGNMVPAAARMPVRYLPLTVNYYIREAFAAAAELVF